MSSPEHALLGLMVYFVREPFFEALDLDSGDFIVQYGRL